MISCFALPREKTCHPKCRNGKKKKWQYQFLFHRMFQSLKLSRQHFTLFAIRFIPILRASLSSFQGSNVVVVLPQSQRRFSFRHRARSESMRWGGWSVPYKPTRLSCRLFVILVRPRRSTTLWTLRNKLPGLCRFSSRPIIGYRKTCHVFQLDVFQVDSDRRVAK